MVMRSNLRRALLLILPTLLLVILVQVRASIPDWRASVVAGEAGALLYVATFDGEAVSSFNRAWSQYEGRLSAAVSGDVLRIAVDELGGGAYSIADPYFGDFDMRVVATATDGTEDNNGFGVIFRLQNRDNETLADDSYYAFFISGDGYYRLDRVVNGVSKTVSDWIESPAIKIGMGETNEIRVIGRANTFGFVINDQPVRLCVPDDPNGIGTLSGGECIVAGTSWVESWADETIDAGRLGVVVQNLGVNDQEVAVTFDNVLIYVPDPVDSESVSG